ncbi:MAG TPA: hypothetical protein VF743_08530 [Acidimicrobiales bacterium]
MRRWRARRWSTGAAAAGALALAVASGCTPEPTPGSVDVAGDSLTIQAIFAHGYGVDAPEDLQIIANIGWRAIDAQPDVSDHAAHGRPATLVVALGTNDSEPTSNGGWDGADVTAFRTLLNTPHPSACVVVVLPGMTSAAPAAHRAELVEARQALVALANERPRTVLVDWQAVVDAHPEYIGPDGIHLRWTDEGPADPEAAAARTALYWSGVRACPAT